MTMVFRVDSKLCASIAVVAALRATMANAESETEKDLFLTTAFAIIDGCVDYVASGDQRVLKTVKKDYRTSSFHRETSISASNYNYEKLRSGEEEYYWQFSASALHMDSYESPYAGYRECVNHVAGSNHSSISVKVADWTPRGEYTEYLEPDMRLVCLERNDVSIAVMLPRNADKYYYFFVVFPIVETATSPMLAPLKEYCRRAT